MKASDLTYRNTGYILIWLERTYYVNVYVYSGTDRSNVTIEMEAGKTAAIGAPLMIPIDSSVVIIASALNTTGAKTAAF